MPLLIDGYNLLNATGLAPRGRAAGNLQRAREALLNTLVESLPTEEIERTVVVFDGSESPWGVAQETNHRGIVVKFAARDDDADSVIERLIKADSAPKRLTVVSSDHRLQRAAKRRKAMAIDSDLWFGQLLRNRAEKAAGMDGARATGADIAKPGGPLSSGEVEHWLREFGLNRQN